MRLLLVFNHYLERGGEAEAFENERDLLIAKGHDVEEYVRDNRELSGMTSLQAAGRTIWSREDFMRIRKRIQRFQPDLIHIHNFFPMISPSIVYAAAYEKKPVVLTLHNFRLLCPSAAFFRTGRVCQDCLGKAFSYPGVIHACYKNDRKATAAVASMLGVHRILGTWKKYVARFIALTPFARQTFIRGGLPERRLVVKPNFLPNDPGYGHQHRVIPETSTTQDFALYVGRLSAEKGIEFLLNIWRRLGDRLRLKIAGDGTLREKVIEASKKIAGIEYLGIQSKPEIFSLMKDAAFLIFPSQCLEGFPMTILEAFAVGTPVLASRLGSLVDIIQHEKTGLLIDPGDESAWITMISIALSQPRKLEELGHNARLEFESHYTAEVNYRQLREIYRRL